MDAGRSASVGAGAGRAVDRQWRGGRWRQWTTGGDGQRWHRGRRWCNDGDGSARARGKILECWGSAAGVLGGNRSWVAEPQSLLSKLFVTSTYY
jgi:hypothetical protein